MSSLEKTYKCSKCSFCTRQRLYLHAHIKSHSAGSLNEVQNYSANLKNNNKRIKLENANYHAKGDVNIRSHGMQINPTKSSSKNDQEMQNKEISYEELKVFKDELKIISSKFPEMMNKIEEIGAKVDNSETSLINSSEKIGSVYEKLIGWPAIFKEELVNIWREIVLQKELIEKSVLKGIEDNSNALKAISLCLNQIASEKLEKSCSLLLGTQESQQETSGPMTSHVYKNMKASNHASCNHHLHSHISTNLLNNQNPVSHAGVNICDEKIIPSCGNDTSEDLKYTLNNDDSHVDVNAFCPKVTMNLMQGYNPSLLANIKKKNDGDSFGTFSSHQDLSKEHVKNSSSNDVNVPISPASNGMNANMETNIINNLYSNSEEFHCSENFSLNSSDKTRSFVSSANVIEKANPSSEACLNSREERNYYPYVTTSLGQSSMSSNLNKIEGRSLNQASGPDLSPVNLNTLESLSLSSHFKIIQMDSSSLPTDINCASLSNRPSMNPFSEAGFSAQNTNAEIHSFSQANANLSDDSIASTHRDTHPVEQTSSLVSASMDLMGAVKLSTQSCETAATTTTTTTTGTITSSLCMSPNDNSGSFSITGMSTKRLAANIATKLDGMEVNDAWLSNKVDRNLGEDTNCFVQVDMVSRTSANPLNTHLQTENIAEETISSDVGNISSLRTPQSLSKNNVMQYDSQESTSFEDGGRSCDKEKSLSTDSTLNVGGNRTSSNVFESPLDVDQLPNHGQNQLEWTNSTTEANKNPEVILNSGEDAKDDALKDTNILSCNLSSSTCNKKKLPEVSKLWDEDFDNLLESDEHFGLERSYSSSSDEDSEFELNEQTTKKKLFRSCLYCDQSFLSRSLLNHLIHSHRKEKKVKKALSLRHSKKIVALRKLSQRVAHTKDINLREAFNEEILSRYRKREDSMTKMCLENELIRKVGCKVFYSLLMKEENDSLSVHKEVMTTMRTLSRVVSSFIECGQERNLNVSGEDVANVKYIHLLEESIRNFSIKYSLNNNFTVRSSLYYLIKTLKEDRSLYGNSDELRKLDKFKERLRLHSKSLSNSNSSRKASKLKLDSSGGEHTVEEYFTNLNDFIRKELRCLDHLKVWTPVSYMKARKLCTCYLSLLNHHRKVHPTSLTLDDINAAAANDWEDVEGFAAKETDPMNKMLIKNNKSVLNGEGNLLIVPEWMTSTLLRLCDRRTRENSGVFRGEEGNGLSVEKANETQKVFEACFMPKLQMRLGSESVKLKALGFLAPLCLPEECRDEFRKLWSQSKVSPTWYAQRHSINRFSKKPDSSDKSQELGNEKLQPSRSKRKAFLNSIAKMKNSVDDSNMNKSGSEKRDGPLPLEAGGEEKIKVRLLGAQSWEKTQSCLFCRKNWSNITKHIFTYHEEETEVQKILAMQKCSTERKTAIEYLRNKGNYLHNIDVLEKGAGEIIPWRCPSYYVHYSAFLPCHYCLGYFQSKEISKHNRSCLHNKYDTELSELVIDYSTLMLPLTDKNLRAFREDIVPLMANDKISSVAQNDPLICQLGACLYTKISYLADSPSTVSKRIREVAVFLNDVRACNDDLKSLNDYLIPEKFADVVKSIKNVSNYRKNTHDPDMRALNLRIRCSLGKCAVIKKSLAIRSGREVVKDECNAFLELMHSSFEDAVSTTENIKIVIKRLNLPLMSDLPVL